MSGSPPAEGAPAASGTPDAPTTRLARLRSPRHRRPLRRSLVIVVVSIAAVVCIAVSASCALALRGSLINQLDDQLRAATSRGLYAPSDAGGDPNSPQQTATPNPDGSGQGGQLPNRPDGGQGELPFLRAPGQSAGTVGVVTSATTIEASGRITQDGSVQELTDAQARALAATPADGAIHTVNLPELGQFRALATVVPDPAGSTSSSTSAQPVMVTGLRMTPVEHTVQRYVWVAAFVSLIGLIAAGFAGRMVVRRTLRPLGEVARTATVVANQQLAQGEVELAERVPAELTDPDTEVGQVGAAVNRMLGHVGDALAARHHSEQQVRQFVADASHELRTPLAAIRGYAELVRRRPGELPEDVALALGRVESESIRMSALVSDLLLLARIDAGRELDHREVDLSEVVVTAVSDAHVAGPDHVWRMDLPQAAISVVGDPDALHQIMVNLLANARLHTPPGTVVRVRLTSAGGRAVVSVADNGPGIDPEVLPRLFERFSRADTSRGHGSGSGSTGLGLAIVAALVAAQDGTVEALSPVPADVQVEDGGRAGAGVAGDDGVGSAVGGPGAMFRVSLPLAGPDGALGLQTLAEIE